MNKALRHEIKMRKYRKRIARVPEVFRQNSTLFCFRTTGKPCSCFMCSPNKYKRKKNNIFDNEFKYEGIEPFIKNRQFDRDYLSFWFFTGQEINEMIE